MSTLPLCNDSKNLWLTTAFLIFIFSQIDFAKFSSVWTWVCFQMLPRHFDLIFSWVFCSVPNRSLMNAVAWVYNHAGSWVAAACVRGHRAVYCWICSHLVDVSARDCHRPVMNLRCFGHQKNGSAVLADAVGALLNVAMDQGGFAKDVALDFCFWDDDASHNYNPPALNSDNCIHKLFARVVCGRSSTYNHEDAWHVVSNLDVCRNDAVEHVDADVCDGSQDG